MPRFPRTVASRLFPAGLCALLVAYPCFAQTTVRSVKILGGKDAVEIEVESSAKLVPQTQALTGPDRLVIDFLNATPGSQLRSQSVNLGQVKDLRVGLFQSKPPVTRVVIDLRTAQTYQIFPNGRTTIIKVNGNAAQDGVSAEANDSPEPVRRPGLVEANYTNRSERIVSANPARLAITQPSMNPAVAVNASAAVSAPARPALEVTFNAGMLSIHSNKATLSEILFAVQQRTGAEVSIAAGAEQEKVVADFGPAPAPEVLAQLLNGSRFNFLILNAANDPRQLDRVILTPRPDRVSSSAPAMAQTMSAAPDNPQIDPQPAPVMPPPIVNRGAPPNPNTPGAQGEGKPDDTDSDQ
jgi:hypothetical protein